MSYVLEARGVSKAFRSYFAVKNVDFGLHRSKIHAVIGPNGAGKTTFFNLLTGLLPTTSGQILLNGDDVTALSLPAMAQRGVVRSFQISAVFGGLSARENVELALFRKLGLAWHFLRSARRNAELKNRAEALLTQFGLSRFADMPAGNLPYGQKRILELATTVAVEPEILLLDEPMAGLGREDIDRVSSLIREVSAGRTVLLVEHNMQVVASLAEHITVMVQGEILAQGSYAEVSARPDVMEAYMGHADG
jgi:branched-chain amino acid transport system ATP-binding protein